MAPLVVLSAMPDGQVPLCATVALPAPPIVAGAPLTVSLATTFAMGVLAVPATAVPLAGLATIEAVTVTVSVTVAQSGGAFLSHSW
jgi:hypothetical protein